jgi:mono/diheme cytochrome c family protein
MTPRRGAIIGLALLAAAGLASGADPVDPSLLLAKPQSNYLLGCGGCHGENGHSNANLVPDLRDQVGYYLATPQGRDYIVRLPNVSFYTASDADLAQILNYVVFTLGGQGVPADARPYTAAEVARLRKSPLTEVSLVEVRSHIVDDLIEHHQAPERMRSYSAQ